MNGVGGPHPESAVDEINLRELWRAVWRRKALLLSCIVLVTGLVAYFVGTMTPLYSAHTLMRIQGGDSRVINIPGLVDNVVIDAPTVASELEYLSSPAFAHRVVERLGLTDDPEFNWRLRPEPEPFWQAWGIDRFVPSAIARLFEEPNGQPEIPRSATEEERTRIGVAHALISRMEVKQLGRSWVIEIRYLSEDPGKAADIANAIAETYIQAHLEQKYQSSTRASSWLETRIEELRADVLAAERRIAEYRAQNRLGIGSEGANSPVSLQMGQINTQLALAQAQRAEAEARYGQVRSLLASAGGPEAAAKVLTSPLMADLRAQETQLQRQLSELGTIYGERHPQMVNVRAELGSVREKIGDEATRIGQDLQNELAVARARERELERQLRGLETQTAGLDQAEVQLRNLVREAETNRQMFETFLQRYSELTEGHDLQQADAQILSRADVPGRPEFPKTTLSVAVAFGGSLMLGLFLVFVVERWDTGFGFRSSDEVLAATGIRALALVPDLGRRETAGRPAEEYILHKPNSAFGEALQRVRTALFLSESDRTPKTVLLTSSVPLEGKSLITSSLARQSARSGLKVLLIDADLRRPRLHEVVRVANQHGLGDILSGRVLVDEAIRTDNKSGMDFIPAGGGVASPPDLFRSESMKVLLRDMAERYDLVLLDSPPVAAVSDSFILSGLVDKTIYVVRWERTPRNVAVASMRQIVEAGADLAGVALSRVNVKKHARYGYPDSGYYSGYYRKYFNN
jgi:polysaccharide biosynthesis transport protein